jgi:hypothetical protein
MRPRAYTAALTLCVIACSSSTAPHQFRGPDGLTLTMTVSRTTVRVGDTTSVVLRISNEQSKLVNVRLGEACPTVELFDASGRAVSPDDSGFCDGFGTGVPVPPPGFAPGESVTVTSVVQVTSSGGVPPFPWIGYAVVPGAYSMSACVSGADASSVTTRTYCAHPVTLTVTQ